MSFDLKTSQPKRPEKQSYATGREERAEDAGQNNHDQYYSANIGEILYSWQAPEFEVYEKSGRWYIIATLFIAAMIIYALSLMPQSWQSLLFCSELWVTFIQKEILIL